MVTDKTNNNGSDSAINNLEKLLKGSDAQGANVMNGRMMEIDENHEMPKKTIKNT